MNDGWAGSPAPRQLCNAHRMATTHAETHIARNADDVWNVFGDFQGLASWFPGVEATPGATDDVRLITMGPGVEITETLLSRDDANRTLTYKVEAAMLNANKYETTIAVTQNADGTSTATMSAELDPDALADFIAPVYEGAIAGLAAHFA